MSGLGKRGLHVPKTIKLYIGGEFPRTESGRTFPARLHGSDQLYAHLCRASRKDFRNAVTAAQGALHSWESRSAYNRAQILYRMAEMAESKREEFSETLNATVGLSEVQANEEIDRAIDAFVYFSGWADKFQQVIGAVNPVTGPHHCFTTAEPVGVTTLVFDEETRLAQVTAAISAIITPGNSVVALLPESTAACLAPLSEVFATSDLPKGVVNLLTGHFDELKSHLGSHMEVQSLSYQRNDQQALKEIREQGSENMKRVVAKVDTPLSLEHLLNFVEYKTVWHPIGY